MLKTAVLLNIYFLTMIYWRILWWIESSKEQHLVEIEIFRNIIDVFNVTFDQFH